MSRHGLLRSTAKTSGGAAPTTIMPKKKRRCGEVMGGATAECTAVVCCCPFAVMDMLVLALYKAPKGMCRKAIDKNRRKRKNARLLKQQRASDDIVLRDGGGGKKEEDVVVVVGKEADEAEAIEAVDLEMYGKFYGTGFWRSSSQRSSSV